MAINIKFDLSGNPELPTIILANRNGNKLGQLKVNAKSVNLNDKFNDASEISFTVNKYVDGEPTPLWDKLVDFKLIYCKEWDLWFEVKVELDEETESVKTAFCTQLGHAELSQIILHNIEINTEDDIARDDYKISILYDGNDKKSSILDRVLEKAPHYKIIHVDDTIKNIQRSFSFDGTSIHDAFQEIAEEIGCLFVYHSNSDRNGKVQRTISVYDLQQNCLNESCRHRGEFTDKCPKCNGTDIKYGYGEDTLIFVTSDELASSGIELTTDTDAVKNCFKLEAGDDLMTATIRNCNPNGTDYIWYLSNSMKEDMSKELIEKLNIYNERYGYYYNDYESVLDSNLVSKYNTLVNKYDDYYNTDSTCLKCDYKGIYSDTCPKCGSKNIISGKMLQSIPTTIKGCSSLMNAYYNTIDLALYLESGLMPSVQMSDTTANKQAALLTSSALSVVSVNTKNIESVSKATADSAVLSLAKIVVAPMYKVEIKSSTYTEATRKWSGSFTVTNCFDENDTADSSSVSVTVKNDSIIFIKQRIEKALNKEDTDDLSISGLFKKDSSDFRNELKKYALNPLKSFYDACDACLNILIDQGAGSLIENPDLYSELYLPYYEKSTAITAEIKLRESEIAIIKGVWNESNENNKILITRGLQYYIEKCRDTIQDALNFEKYLGEELWLEFCSYRREDTYSNENYISDGLGNAELFEKALEFIEVAEDEIYKSSELQHSISTSLNNLLAIDKFKPLIDSFEVGNWIRVQVDDEIYKLRLLEYEIDFGNFEEIPVEFSEVTKIKNGITDIESVLSQASSMAASYDSIQRQAKQGDNAKGTIDQWLTKGLNSALVRIQSNNNEEVILNENGLLCRSYDDITESYLPEQFRLTHNIMAYTNDGWNTVSTALGKHDYIYYNSNKTRQEGADYGLSAKFVTAGYVNGSQIIGGEIYSQNYSSTTGTYMDLNQGLFSWAGGKIKYDGNDLELTGVNLVWRDIEGAIDNSNGEAEDKIQSFIDADHIKTLNLTVGNEIKMGSDAQITWENLPDEIATKDYVTTESTRITKNTVTTSYVNALKVTAGSVAAENISGTTITGKTISGGKLSGVKGEIGGWTIDTNKIYAGDSSTGTCVMQKPTENSLHVFAAGGKDHSNYSDCPFRVTKAGKLYAKDAVISGSSSFAGALSGVSGTFTTLKTGDSSFSAKQIKISTPSAKAADGAIYIGDSGVTGWEDITIRPSGDNLGNIGTAGKSWDILYVKNGAVQSSDRNRKRDITRMGEKQEQLFNLLSPVTFKFIDSSYDRYHYGFISQEVEDAIIESGLTTKDFAGFCKDVKRDDDGKPVFDKDGNQEYVYSLRYNEFIALNTHMIQKLQAENQKLKERIDSLEKTMKQLS